MSGPASIGPVLARISEIQTQLGVGVEVTPIAGAPTAASSGAGLPAAWSASSVSFASALADASGQGVRPASGLPSSGLPSSWAIPWAAGKAPASIRTPSTRAVGAAAAPAARSAAASTGDVQWPLRGTITQTFGPTTCTLEPSATVNGHTYAHYHDGLDIGAAQGTPVRSMASGTVEFAGRYPDGAVVVRVRHADDSVALYAHLEPSLDVSVGDHVAAGTPLGNVGMTGHTTGPHLHMELTVKGHTVDPLPVLRSGDLPGAAKASTPSTGAAGWTASSPLAATDGKLNQAALDRFDAVAGSIPLHAEIRDAAVRAGIDPLLLASLVKAESGFRPDAVSSAGAQGLCQLMPATAKSLGVTDPFDAVQNVRAGARYFANNLRIYGRADLALAAYHDGKGAVASAGGVPDYPVTHRYIDRVMSYWTHYREAAA
ncbi:MAG: peptidoglycan DD-metalloendopeptidase family protein [Candidatus Limnocylindrales bacterium]